MNLEKKNQVKKKIFQFQETWVFSIMCLLQGNLRPGRLSVSFPVESCGLLPPKQSPSPSAWQLGWAKCELYGNISRSYLVHLPHHSQGLYPIAFSCIRINRKLSVSVNVFGFWHLFNHWVPKMTQSRASSGQSSAKGNAESGTREHACSFSAIVDNLFSQAVSFLFHFWHLWEILVMVGVVWERMQNILGSF